MNISIDKFLLIILCLLPITIMIGKAALNINLLIFDILVIFYFFKNKNFFQIKITKNFITTLSIIIFFLVNILLSSNIELSLRGFLGLLKNIIFCIGLGLLINYSDIKKYFSLVIIFCLTFVSINILLQFYFGKDLFGNSFVGQYRSTAVFGNQIPGSYIMKFLYIGLLLPFIRGKLFINLIYFSFFSFMTIITNERMSLLNVLFFSFFFLMIFPGVNWIKKITTLTSYFLLCLIFFNIPIPNKIKINESKNIYEHLSSRTKLQFERQFKKDNFYSIYWIQHFRTATEIFLDKPLVGSGIKTYRYECPKQQFQKKEELKLLCSIHPHNFYFEIISELGLMGFIIFSYLLIPLIFKIISHFLKDKKNRYEISVILFPLLMLFNPVQITGSIFSTYNGFFLFMVIGVAINYIKNFKIK